MPMLAHTYCDMTLIKCNFLDFGTGPRPSVPVSALYERFVQSEKCSRGVIG